MKLKASKEQLDARLDLRKSGATTPYENKFRTAKRPGHGNRNRWKKELVK